MGITVMSIIEKLVGTMDDKRAFREYKRRVAALPREYNIVMSEMQNYIWNCGSLDGSLDLLYDLLALMEASTAEGKEVLEVTGSDVTAFCDELIREWKGRTWQDSVREKFNERIHRRLGGTTHDGD